MLHYGESRWEIPFDGCFASFIQLKITPFSVKLKYKFTLVNPDTSIAPLPSDIILWNILS